MSMVQIRQQLRRPRARVAVVLSLLTLAGAVAAHHDLPMDMHGMAAATACLAVLAVGVVAAVTRSVTVTPLPRPERRLDVASDRPAPRQPTPGARAGPGLYLQLAVLRR